MKILITGGIGHIGTNICNEAIRRGHQVIVMDNLHREEVIDNLSYLKRQTEGNAYFEFIWGDVRNQTDFDRIPKVDAIIHLAANPGVPWSIKWPIYDFETNARGTLNVLEFARKQGNIRFVYASTNKTFSDIINAIPKQEDKKRYRWMRIVKNYDNPLVLGVDQLKDDTVIAINENFPISGFGRYGHSMYGISKLVGDLYCQEYHVQYGLPMVINKMSCIYGLFQKGCPDQGWISAFILAIMRNEPITFYGTGKQVRDVLDARDVARLYIDELEEIDKCNGEIFTVGGGPKNTISLIEAVEEIEKQLGKKAKIEYGEKRPADQSIYISSIKHVGEIMNWKPTIPFKRTVHDMIAEYGKREQV